MSKICLLFTVGATLVAAGCGSDNPPAMTPDAGQDRPQGLDRPPDFPKNEAGNYCTDPTGPGTTHDETEITGTTSWSADTGPHIVKHDIKIGSTTALATLTIEPCATVKFEKDAGFTVAPDGMRGALYISPVDNDHPVTLTGTSETPGAWKGIYFGTGNGNADSTASAIAYTSILWAGGPSGRAADAALYLDGTGKSPKTKASIELEVNGVTISGSAKYGIYTTSGGHLKNDPSATIIITGNAYHAVRTEAEYVVNLPAGTYSGNTVEGIEIQGGNGTCACFDDLANSCPEGLCVRSSGNWAARGVPYIVNGVVHIGHATSTPTEAATTITLTGLQTLRMAADSAIEVGVGINLRGALRLQADKLTMTPDAATVTPGFWRGIVFGRYADWEGTGSRIKNTTIEGAGKALPAAVPHTCGSATIDGKQGGIIFNLDDPKNPFPPPFKAAKFQDITTTTFQDISGHGIVRGWDQTDASDSDPDFTDAAKMNTFKRLGGCAQTNNQVNGTCSPCTP